MSILDKIKGFLNVAQKATTPQPNSEELFDRAAELIADRFNARFPASSMHALPNYPDPNRDYAGDYAEARQRLLETFRTEVQPGMSAQQLADRAAKRMGL